MEVWFIEWLKAFGRLFIQPLFYWPFIVLVCVSLARIRKERNQFGTKIFDIFSEQRGTKRIAFSTGIVLSLLAVGAGVVFPYPLILLISAVTILLSLTLSFTWLSAVYTLGISYLILLFGPPFINVELPAQWRILLDTPPLTVLACLIGLLLLVEGLQLLRLRSNETYPELVQGSRGKRIGQHRLKKLSILPFFALLPGESLQAFASWWPVFPLGQERYGLILIPLVTGFDWMVNGQKPIVASKRIGRRLFMIALVTISLAAASYWIIWLSFAAVLIAIAGREWVSFSHRLHEKHQPYFAPSNQGLPILAVIPGSPADDMGVQVGEKVEVVNGLRITSEEGFYYALQKNLAYCKMEVRDERGEMRFVQRAMYEGAHHELGLLFVKPQERRAYLEAQRSL
ncbi:PDZ domain-containing protein [Thalassobacillus sp. CUG 92003]|uniref:PDZ domain-containing protein n=1 Tax=Thalassobacillus sp. CUG 92003 TaxID=2736641 RepID=UPI0015E79EDE|nr:PDZ domain-containing protein [Thalassobacillus sp. CUG 92003]